MEKSIDIEKLNKLFEQMIAASEYVNKDEGNIQVEDMDELKNCIGLFTDFGLYVESRITQIVAKHKVLKDENKPDIDSNMSENEDKQTINVGALKSSKKSAILWT